MYIFIRQISKIIFILIGIDIKFNSKFNIILINIFNKRDDDKIYTSNYVKIQRQK